MVQNKMKKRFVSIILIGFFCIFNSVSLWSNEMIIRDDANLLTENERALLQKDMSPILEYGNVAFVTNEASYSGEAPEFAEKLCNSLFNGKSSTVFLIDMYNRRIEIYSTGDIYKVINRYRANGIADSIYTYATDKKYYECAKECFGQMLFVLEGGSIAVPMKYVSNLLMAFGIVFSLLFLLVYASRVKTTFGREYELVKKDRDFEEEADDDENAINKRDANSSHVIILDKTKVKEKKKMHFESTGGRSFSSGSSRSGGGGHSSGGGHSGGGGGHGF